MTDFYGILVHTIPPHRTKEQPSHLEILKPEIHQGIFSSQNVTYHRATLAQSSLHDELRASMSPRAYLDGSV